MGIINKLTAAQKLGLYLLVSLLIFAFGQPLIFNQNPAQQNLNAILNLPSLAQPLGTDQYGRSMFVRLASALRLSFSLVIFAVLSAVALGTFAGLVAAWGKKSIAATLDFIVTNLMALPGLILVLLFAAMIPGSFIMIYLAISIVLSLDFYRVIRASSKQLIASKAFEASHQLGFNRRYLFKRHIWPDIKTSILTLSAFGAANAVLMMASIGFVYVGLKPPTAELGLMIVELFPYYADAPWLIAQPILALTALILSFNLLAGKIRR